MTTKAESFAKTLVGEFNIEDMIYKVINTGGQQWGNEKTYIVQFGDGSYYSAAIFYPEDSPAYYNGSAKVNP